MAAEIVHNDDVTRLKLRDENLMNIGAEAFAVDRAVEQASDGETVTAQCAKECQRPPVTVWREAAHPLAFWSPSAQWSHVGLDRTGPVKLSIGHKFSSDHGAQRDVGEV